MDQMFKIKQECGCELIITDTSHCLNQDTIIVDIVTLDKISGTELIAIVFTTHDKHKNLNEVKLPLGNDGFIHITHLLVPTIHWYNEQLSKPHNKLCNYKNIYLADQKNIYVINNNKLDIIDPLELIGQNQLKNTTIIKSQESIFLTCYLTKCYINLCHQVIKSLYSNNKSKNGHCAGECDNVDYNTEDIIYKRDLLWITLNVIRYLIEDNLFEEAEQILEDFQNCRGICYDVIPQQTSLKQFYSTENSQGILYTVDCGCGK